MIHTAVQKSKFIRFVRFLRKAIPSIPVSHETVAVGILERLWHLTCNSAPRGDIGKLEDVDISEMTGWHGDPEDLIGALVDTRWLDPHPTFRLIVHDWHEHAPAFIKGNVRRMGGFVTERAGPSLGDRPIGPSYEDRPLGMVVPNLTKPNLTKPNLTQSQIPRESEPESPPFENPIRTGPPADTPFFRPSEIDGRTDATLKRLGEINAEAKRTPIVSPSARDRDRLSEAICLFGAKRCENLWHWAINSPHTRAKFFRQRSLVTVRQLFDPEKVGELLEIAEANDAWAAEIREGPNEADPIEQYFAASASKGKP